MNVARFDENSPWLKLFVEFGLPHKPFILEASCTSKWASRKSWCTSDDEPNLQYLKENYGLSEVPLLDDNGDCSTMPFGEYLDGIGSGAITSRVYLKDWHFQKCYGTSMYNLHPFFVMDWINCENWTDDATKNPFGDDYRFVYFGIAGTWTKFHSDVVASHSWSANICGLKQWYMIAPGQEKLFLRGKDFVEDMRTVDWSGIDVIQFVQKPGEIVFVPSNWYHQVHNITDSISINHNWINATNIQTVRKFIEQRKVEVEKEIDDSREHFTEEEFAEQIELILFADARLNDEKLKRLSELVIDSRCDSDVCYVCPRHGYRITSCITDHKCKHMVTSFCSCTMETCSVCRQFVKSLELTVASTLFFDE